MAKLRSEGGFDPLQGAPTAQLTGDGTRHPAGAGPATGTPGPLGGELGGAESLFAILEQTPSVIMVADAGLDIVFANQMARETLQNLDGELRAAFGLGADQIVGNSMHVFHRNPSAVEKTLAALTDAPHHTEIRFGNTIVASSIKRLKKPGGELLGYAVNWHDITDLDQARNETAQIKHMVDNAPSNLMMADTDLNITYINPAMRQSFEKIRDHMPVQLDRIVGSSLDLFHSAPQHQRSLLSDPDRLPHEANFEIGGEKVRLLVNAIYDHAGRYIGPMATWEFVTEKLQLENDRQAAVEREKQLAESLSLGVAEILESVQAAAEGNLSRQVEVSGDGAVAQVGEGLRRFFEALRQQITVISRTSKDMAGASDTLMAASQQMGANSEETSTQANSVSSSARTVSNNLQTIAAAIELMTISISEISTNTTKGARMAQEAVSVTETTNGIIAKLGERSSEIGNVTKQISSIAEQTNLLALNATIEAARAGEAGKGFAVVANEVKELARETGDATEDIGTKIEAIQAEIENAVKGISQVSDIIRQINDVQMIVASAVEEQTSTSGEMSQNINAAASGSLSISNNIEGVADAAQNAAAGAHETQSAAEGLGKMSVELQALVSHFKLGEDQGQGGEESVEQLIEALEEAGYARADILKALEETQAR
jgi:methyl-accepting chemotaxis protein